MPYVNGTRKVFLHSVFLVVALPASNFVVDTTVSTTWLW